MEQPDRLKKFVYQDGILSKRYGIHQVYLHSHHAPVCTTGLTYKGISLRCMVWQLALVQQYMKASRY